MQDKISCKICGKKFDFITSGHLKKHNSNVKSYKKIFPQAKILSSRLRETLREKSWSKQSLPEINEKRRVSMINWINNNPEKAKQRIEQQKDKPKHSEEYKRKLSESYKGIHFTPQTEFKKGHKVSHEWIEKIRQKKIGKSSLKKGKSYISIYGEERTKEILDKLSKAHQNKKLTKIHKESISLSHKRKFENEDFKQEFARRFNKKPGKSENQLIKIINEKNLPFKYTGDYSFWIGNKNPDFINSKGKSQVIELLGEYWHQKRKNIRFHQTVQGTIEHYKKFGFNCLVIWDYELKQPRQVLQKIQEFCSTN